MRPELPARVIDALLQLTLDSAPTAYLRVGKDGMLRDAGGNLAAFNLEHLEPSTPVTSQIIFLESLLPLAREPVVVPTVDLGSGRYADLHLLPDEGEDWILMLDKSNAARWKLMAQQKANELSLLRQLDVPTAKAHLIFINGVKKNLQSTLNGGERVGIFPPVAGG